MLEVYKLLRASAMAVPHSASFCSPFMQGDAWQWRRTAMRCEPTPSRRRTGNDHLVGVLVVECASKSVVRVLEEAESVSAKALVRRSRSLSPAAQTELLGALVQRGPRELVLPLYEAVSQGARYKWNAELHARVVALASKDAQASSLPLEPQGLSLKERAELECALIASFMSEGLVGQAHDAFRRLCELPLAKSRSLGYRAMARAYSAAENPVEAEKMLKAFGCSPSLDDYKAVLLGFGRLGMVADMERVAGDLRSLDTAGFNIMISAYCRAGMLERMVETVLQMDVAGVRLSLVSWNALTKACRTLVAVCLEGTGALASPQTLCNRLQTRGASAAELKIVQVLLGLGLPPECVTFSADVWELDLHSMSVGTASIMFCLWLRSLRDRFQADEGVPVEVRLVTGWGRHSRSDVRAPVRRMILGELEALESSFRADSQNRGAFITRGHLLKKWLLSLPS